VPELPDLDVYIEKLGERIGGEILKDIRVGNPFLVRSFDPPIREATGRRVKLSRRIGKRIVIGLEPDYYPGCQTGGRILADRSLSRLLKDDWPDTL